MNNILNTVKHAFNTLLSFIPTKLPIGMDEFNDWAASVLALTGLPDNDSTRFALAGMIAYQKPDRFYTPKRLFALMMLKAAANQIGGAVMYELKEKQKTAEAERKQAEATALSGSSGQEISQA